MKIIVTIVQLVFALVTLYRTRGDQITMFGYAAFGLTVAQYAWMSLLNLIGSLVCPSYPIIFLIESQTLNDLRARVEAAGQTVNYPLSGTVGELTGQAEEEILRSFDETGIFGVLGSTVSGPYFGAVRIAIIGGLSKFSPGGSALYQRVWTMMWLVVGFLFGPAASLAIEAVLHGAGMYTMPDILIIFLAGVVALGIYAAPAIGGLVVVGQMILDYGVCIRLREVAV